MDTVVIQMRRFSFLDTWERHNHQHRTRFYVYSYAYNPWSVPNFGH